MHQAGAKNLGFERINAFTRAMPTGCPTGPLTRCRKFLQAAWTVLRERPGILLIAVSVFALLLATGLASVLTAARVSVRNAKDLAAHGLGNQVAQSLKEALLIATFGSELLATVVTREPRCAALDRDWNDIAADIMGKVNQDVVKQLELDVAGVIWKTHPPLQGKTAEILYGRDMLRTLDDRPGMIYALTEKCTLFLGPYTCQDGFKCAFAVTPLFLPAPSESYDWGCGYQPYNCTDLCWDPELKVKFWGQVSTMVDLDQLLGGQDQRLQVLQQRGYNFQLWQASTSVSNPHFVLANTSAPPSDPVTLRIAAYNVVWYLELSPAAGWMPAWRGPCIAVVVVGSLLVALLVLWLLVSKEQHNMLLRAMLPLEVIKQLQSGDAPIAQEYEQVTVLFSDIVGYTCVASQLSPRQVITLLNEVFSVFDKLTLRNQVYKVETIGDALMCVAGCPVPDDPVRSAVRIANMALDMIQAVEQFRPSLEGVRVQIRVGIHSGPVVAGVVGKKMPRYCLFGDTVNTSSRMESTSQPMKIQVSSVTAALLQMSGQRFELEPRGPVQVKGKGTMETFWLCPGPQPAPRGKSFLDALERPATLIIRPAPPRLATRTQTFPELGPRPSSSGCLHNTRSLPVSLHPIITSSTDSPPLWPPVSQSPQAQQQQQQQQEQEQSEGAGRVSHALPYLLQRQCSDVGPRQPSGEYTAAEVDVTASLPAVVGDGQTTLVSSFSAPATTPAEAAALSGWGLIVGTQLAAPLPACTPLPGPPEPGPLHSRQSSGRSCGVSNDCHSSLHGAGLDSQVTLDDYCGREAGGEGEKGGEGGKGGCKDAGADGAAPRPVLSSSASASVTLSRSILELTQSLVLPKHVRREPEWQGADGGGKPRLASANGFVSHGSPSCRQMHSPRVRAATRLCRRSETTGHGEGPASCQGGLRDQLHNAGAVAGAAAGTVTVGLGAGGDSDSDSHTPTRLLHMLAFRLSLGKAASMANATRTGSWRSTASDRPFMPSPLRGAGGSGGAAAAAVGGGGGGGPLESWHELGSRDRSTIGSGAFNALVIAPSESVGLGSRLQDASTATACKPAVSSPLGSKKAASRRPESPETAPHSGLLSSASSAATCTNAPAPAVLTLTMEGFAAGRHGEAGTGGPVAGS